MKISYMIILVFYIYILHRSYRAMKARGQINNVTLVGYSNYGNILATLFNMFFVPFIATLDSAWKYGLLVILVCLQLINDRVYLGDNGVKVNGLFIPKTDILSYHIVDGKVDQFELFVRGRERLVRISVNKRKLERRLDEILAEWKAAS